MPRRRVLTFTLAALLTTGVVAGCSSFTEFVPRQRPQPDESAQQAIDALPRSAEVTGNLTLGGKVLYTYSGYVNFSGDCSEEMRIERLPLPDLEDDNGEVIEVVRSEGTTYTRVVAGDSASEQWSDPRSGAGAVVASFMPSFYAYGNPFGPGVCGLTDATYWVTGNGTQDTWDIDVERSEAYLLAVTDEYMAWMLTDPTLGKVGRATATRTVNAMRDDAVYDVSFAAVLSGSSLTITNDSVVYTGRGGDGVDTWQFVPVPVREVQTPAGAEPATPLFVE